MKQIFEFIPLIAFFIAVKYYDIYVATGVIMAVSAVQIAVMLALKQEITKMQWSVTGLVLVMGTLTLVFHDERFIKWKPTLVYWAFALALLISAIGFGKNLIKAMLGSILSPPDAVWRKLNWAWVAFFIALGALNLFLAEMLSTENWALAKIGFGLITMIFAGLQLYIFRQYLRLEKPAANDEHFDQK